MYKTIVLISLCFVLGGCASHEIPEGPLPESPMPAVQSIDMRGKSITTYILYNTVIKLQTMQEGDVIEVVTDNYTPIENDMLAWLRMTGHELAGVEKREAYLRFYVRKTTAERKHQAMAIVISNAGLEELLTPLGFALGAELAGIEVSLYFQGPAVRVLKKGFTEKLGGLSWPFSGFARKGLEEAGHVRPQEKLREMKELGGKIYACGPSMDHFGVKKEELIFDDVIIAEYVTFLEVMSRADIQLFP